MSSRTIVRELKKQARAGYAWKSGSQITIKPDVAMAEFRAIHDAHGHISPALVVEQAVPDENPLHPEFEWDDATAATAHRESQARDVMRSIVMVIEKEDGTLTHPVRAIVKVTPEADAPALSDDAEDMQQPNRYMPMREVMSDEEARQLYVRKALQDLLTWRRRYKDIQEFSRIFEDIERIAAQIAS